MVILTALKTVQDEWQRINTNHGDSDDNVNRAGD
jgi:hypothetical protein